MENQELELKNIIISAVEQTQWGFKLKDEKGLVYNVPATKKDGTATKAYQDLTALPNNGMNLNKCVKFATVQNNQGGQSRYVRMITEPVIMGQPTNYVSPVMNQSKPVTIEKETVNWDDVNFGKCKHAYLLIAFKHQLENNSKLDGVEELAEEWATMSMRKLDKKPTAQDVANMVGGTIVDEIYVENIPF